MRQCLDSITGQTLEEIQIVLVNDGSSDSSGDICEHYAKNDDRVIYIQKSNGGLASARDAGLNNASGEYVGFVDADDWVELNMFEKMYSVAMNYSADIVLCDSVFNGKINRSAHLPTGFYDKRRIQAEIFPHTLASFSSDKKNERIRWSNCVRLYRKELIDQNNIEFDNRFRRCQDLPFTFECTIHASSIYYLGDEYLYHNRPVFDSLSKGYTRQMWELLKPLMQYLDVIVKGYSCYDFSAQMSLRSFMFTVNCIENEAKPNNKRGAFERLRTIREIMQDDYVRDVMSNLDTSSISRLYRAYSFALKHRLSIPAYLVAHYRLRNLRRRYKATTLTSN